MKATYYLSIWVLFSFSSINAQNDMLIGQLATKLVVRENFDKNGNLLNQQTFRGGKVTNTKSYYELEVVTELFDQSGESKDRYTTIYRCDPKESSIMIMAFPFSNPESNETEINTTSKNFKGLYDLNNLKDIELEMSFDSGLLSFFGSKSIIKIYDRKLDINKINIKSKINIKAYAWGIRIKQLNYSVNEKLDNKGLLTFQKFTEEDGSYFTMNYK
jgi:hypothetical protein